MHVINARNVNDAYRKGMRHVLENGQLLPSRNGPVRRAVDPVCTKYARPTERVLFDAKRDANPFFHLFEALWMLNGGNDTDTLHHVLASFRQFSDNGKTFHGAYGYRWRHWPSPSTTYTREIDQIAMVIKMLRANCDDRRAIICMWDPNRDLGAVSKDIPCNDLIKVAIVNGSLDMQVFNRSNDIVFGCYGANAVHMSMLQEYLAAMIEVPVGRYFQISGDFHAYTESPYTWETYWPLTDDGRDERAYEWTNPYDELSHDRVRLINTYPLVTNAYAFDAELQRFMVVLKDTRSVMALDPKGFANTFFRNVVIPMHWALEYHLQKNDLIAINTLHNQRMWLGQDNDWLVAGEQWLIRRVQRRINAGQPWEGDDAAFKQYIR